MVEELWSDYAGDDVYADFTISGGAGSTVRSFAPGIARVLTGVSQGSGWTDYYHADHLGTTRRMTAPNGSVIESSAFTAFGERSAGTLSGPEDRYAYVGAFGYQADADFDILHVGHRYYDPTTGRFLQRDPVGIWDDLNVYAYVASQPTTAIDPGGETALRDLMPDTELPGLLGPDGPIFGHGRGLNKGKTRVGWSKVRTGYRRSVSRFAIRHGTRHLGGVLRLVEILDERLHE